MKALTLLFIIGCLAASAMVAATASTVLGGALLLLCGLIAGGLNLLRALASTSKSSMAKREGLGLFGLGLLSFVALGSAFGTSAWRAAVADEERRIAEKVAQAPSIAPFLDSAENHLAEGRLDDCAAQLGIANARLKELRGYEAHSPLIGALQNRLEVLTEQRWAEMERLALASAAAAEHLTGAAGLEAMLQSAEALRQVPALSAAGKEGLAALEEKLITESHKTGVFSQPVAVLKAQLLSTPPAKSGDSYTLGHLQGARGLAEAVSGKTANLYLVAEPRPGALSDAAATAFVELSVGPLKTAPLWKAPAGKGSRTATRTLNGVVIHEGWSDDKLVELWAGDFKP